MVEKLKLAITPAGKGPKPGDTRDLDDDALDRLRFEDGAFDSYSNTYIMDGLRWKIETKVCHPGGRTVYTLRAQGDGQDQALT